MCGLTGIIYTKSQIPSISESKYKIKKMTDTLRNRGPDDEGYFFDKKVILGHRRLKIQDLSENGAQPMQLSKNGPVLIFNGEIYNFKILKRELLDKGYKFKGNSDTEVILQVFNEWGFEGLNRLEGIFAFAIWDPLKDELILFRDRLGVKPLFYSETDYGFVFGSEIKSVLEAGGININLNDQALSEYLWYGNSYEDRTFYQGIKSLLPGQYLIIKNEKKILEFWWKIEEWLKNSYMPEEKLKAQDELLDSLDLSVKRQMISDVPLAIFLSGGIDSSAIASSARQNNIKKINSYSASFDFEDGVDESEKAALVAKSFNLNHHAIKIEGKNLMNIINELAIAHDEPFADAANIPLYLMCKKLDPSTKVVLQGDGGDELFGGYVRYQILAYSNVFKFFPNFLSNFVNLFGKRGYRYSRILDTITQINPALRNALLLTLETQRKNPDNIFLKDRKMNLRETTNPFLAYLNAGKRFKGFDAIQRMLLTDLTLQLPSQFLTKVDRATMAAGIEARVPLLDENIASRAIGLPSEWKVNRQEKKIILRDLLRGRLPGSILDGPKTGFGVPYDYWIKTSLHEQAKEIMLDDSFIKNFHIDKAILEKKISNFKNDIEENGFLLWKIFQLALWNSRHEKR